MQDVIFTSYCFGDAYLSQQIRLRESILSIYPNANLHFENEPESTGKPKFQKSLYGFKVRIIRECMAKGFRRVIFFDTAITLVGPVDHWFTLTPIHGALAAIDRSPLDRVTSNNCLAYLKLSRELVSQWNLCGGSIYVFDFDVEKCRRIWHMWEAMERDGIFGTQDDLSHNRLQAHRMDETCMALSMYLNKSAPLGHDAMRYGWMHPETGVITQQGDVPLIALKKHFK